MLGLAVVLVVGVRPVQLKTDMATFEKLHHMVAMKPAESVHDDSMTPIADDAPENQTELHPVRLFRDQ